MSDMRAGQSFIKPHFRNLATSGALLQGFTAEVDLEEGRAENAGPYPAMTSRHILLVKAGRQPSTRLEWSLNGRRKQREFLPGDLILNPAGLLTRPQWDKSVELLVLAIHSNQLVHSSTQLDGSPSIELVPGYGFQDDLLTGLLQAITREFREPNPDPMYAEALANAATHHLLRRYATRPVADPISRGRLSKHKLREIHDYMHAHLGRRVTLAELAALAGLSTSHFVRLFRLSTGVPPHQRLMSLRLRRAEDLLQNTALPIAEVAALTGFADQSHLTRLFRQHKGTTPSAIRSTR